MMGWWSAYFFAKLLLFAGGYIDFHAGWNLLLATALALPPRNDRQRLTKNLLGSILAVVLLYHDSWLPPPARVLSQAGYVSEFTAAYLIDLLGRFFSWRVLLQLALLFGVYVLLKRKLRMSTFVFIGIFAVMLAPWASARWQARNLPMVSNPVAATASATAQPILDLRTLSGAALDQRISDFYRNEQLRQVQFQSQANDATPFDVLLLHVCSLSWDDLDAAGQRDDALFKRFDVMFTEFNSAASYSGPAAIRLLRGNCGQTTHQALYEPATRRCLVMDGFQDAGFEPQWLMNHDGHFGNFFADVRDRGGMPAQLQDVSGAEVAQRSFDGTPIYDDYSALSRWWQKRLANPAARVALYYNSVSLHDGNRFEGKSLADSPYTQRLQRFTRDLGRFLDDVQRSGRHLVVILIPEHGAALRGDRRQIQGLREIPTPAISHVPVGVMLVNAARAADAAPVTLAAPVSYLAVNELLARFMSDNPFSRATLNVAEYLHELPQTESVAENEGTVIYSVGDQAMLRTPDGAWTPWQATR